MRAIKASIIAVLACLSIVALIGPALAEVDAATADANSRAVRACTDKEFEANRDGRACIGRISDPCLEKPENSSTQAMADCVRAETAAWDRLLNADYKDLLAVLNAKAKESVMAAERAWIAARDADCKVPYDIFEGGTMAQLDGASCDLDRTATRLLQVHSWRLMAGPEEH
jgi:uncharacterized protein YecT (DUF1311 family)